ncbi:TPA: IS1595 family transposase, partial [Neisseria meningitidis]
KGRLAKFHGISKEMFYLHLKETEFRFNHRHEDLGKILMKMLRNNPI